MQDVLGDRAPCRGRVHHAVAGKTGNHVEVVERPLPVADDRVAIQLALLVVSRPGAMTAGSFERGEPVGDGGPDDAFELVYFDVSCELDRETLSLGEQ